MKKNLFLLIVVALGVACVSEPPQESQPKSPVVGGYAPADPADPMVQEAASHAVEFLSADKDLGPVTLVSVKKAEVQVVAGLNYRMTLVVSAPTGAKTVDVVVYKNLKNEYSLTSFKL